MPVCWCQSQWMTQRVSQWVRQAAAYSVNYYKPVRGSLHSTQNRCAAILSLLCKLILCYVSWFCQLSLFFFYQILLFVFSCSVFSWFFLSSADWVILSWFVVVSWFSCNQLIKAIGWFCYDKLILLLSAEFLWSAEFVMISWFCYNSAVLMISWLFMIIWFCYNQLF